MPIAWHLSWWNGCMSIDYTKGTEKLWNDESILKFLAHFFHPFYRFKFVKTQTKKYKFQQFTSFFIKFQAASTKMFCFMCFYGFLLLKSYEIL